MTRRRAASSQASPTTVSDEPHITPETLAGAPELAVIAILEETLRITGDALLAAQPALLGEPPPWRVTADLIAARRLLRHAATLGRAVADYRHCVLQQLHDEPDDDELPF